MMDCLEFRRIAGADPGSRDSGFLRHRLACGACAEHVQGLESLDRALDLAMALPVPEGLAARIKADAALRQGYERRWMAVAASLVLMIGALGVTWQLQRDVPVHMALVEHVFHEPDALLNTGERVPLQRISAVMERGGARLAQPIDGVSFAALCPFRGRNVPHLVIDGRDGPVSVMLLPHVKSAQATRFEESGLSGTLIPVGEGSIAIIAEPGVDTGREAELLRRTVNWDI